MSPRRTAIVAAVVAVLVAASVVVALSVGGERAGRLVTGSSHLRDAAASPPAPELDGIAEWLNTRPLTMKALRGRVVLVDFWTYSCINCRRTFPFLKALYATYADRGLTVLGVHTPEFDFEKVPANVERAVRALGVTWPVAEDPDRATWDAYQNEYWPADWLVDRQGRIRLLHVGEGGDREIENAVRELLGDPGPARIGSVTRDAGGGNLTPELYLGDRRADRTDPIVRIGRFETDQEWVAAAAAGATVRLTYRARDVYAVLAPPAGTAAPQRIEVRLDGRPIPVGRRGRDVVVAGGRTYVDVTADDLYHLVTGSSVGGGFLTMEATGPGVRWFTFTFGG